MDVGDIVALRVPDEDRAPTDPINILCVVLDKDKNNLYKIGCEAGILKTKCARNDFDTTELKGKIE